jgi:hypothetical protein
MQHGEYETDPPPTFTFDRRAAERWTAPGPATAFRLSGGQFGQILDLDTVDLSAGGVAVTCADPIEPGAMLSLSFSQSGQLARRGVVRRCVPCGEGYRLGIQFQLGLAA